MAGEDPLRPLLDEAEAKLARRLREACEAESHGIASESAAEIRRLEDSLLSAAMAAEQVLAVRRHMRRQAGAAADSSGTTIAAVAAPAVNTEQGASTGGTEPSQPGQVDDTPRDASGSASASDPGERTTVREFTDCKGRTWRAWPVTPNTARSNPSSLRTLGEFQEGWICFESLDDSARRRLPRRQTGWAELREEELERLLDQAINVPGRKRATPEVPPGPDVRLH